jgi:hypothetical protein
MASPRRSSHPDDALRRLARSGKPNLTASAFQPPTGRGINRKLRWFLVGVGAVAFLVLLPFFRSRDVIVVNGLKDGMSITRSDLQNKPITIAVKPLKKLGKVVVRINGQVGTVEPNTNEWRWIPPDLVDAPHTLTIRSGSRFLWRAPAQTTIHFQVDSKAPGLTVEPIPRLTASEPFVVKGAVDEEVDLTVDGVPVTVKDGQFRVQFKFPPIGAIRVVAVDRAGTITAKTLDSNVVSTPMRGILAPADAWVDAGRRTELIKLVEEGRINTIVLDLKNDSGQVNFKTNLAAVKNANAATELFDLRQAVAELHARGVRVLGRVVTFRDPLYAKLQWSKGEFGDAVQTLDGSMFADEPGPWLNPASKGNVEYISAIVREAADLGVDVVLLDGVERPEGKLEDFKFEGLSTEIPEPIKQTCPRADYFEASTQAFIEQLAIRLRGTPARLGVMVNGSAAVKPKRFGQNIDCLAKLTDFIAPTVMPSEFKNRSFAVLEPAAHPTEMVSRSLSSFLRSLGRERGKSVLVPWLQDYSKGRTYGVTKVSAQIKATNDLGLRSFLLWDPKATYSAEALTVDVEQRDRIAAALKNQPNSAPTVAK